MRTNVCVCVQSAPTYAYQRMRTNVCVPTYAHACKCMRANVCVQTYSCRCPGPRVSIEAYLEMADDAFKEDGKGDGSLFPLRLRDRHLLVEQEGVRLLERVHEAFKLLAHLERNAWIIIQAPHKVVELRPLPAALPVVPVERRRRQPVHRRCVGGSGHGLAPPGSFR